MMVKIRDAGVQTQELLSAFSPLEPLLTSLLSSSGSVFLLNNVVAPNLGNHVLVIDVEARELSDGRSVTPELISVDDLWDVVFTQQFGQKVCEEGAPLTSKREIYRLIEAQPTDSRQDLPGGLDVFPFLEKAMRDLLTESGRAVRKSRVRLPLRGSNLKVANWLQDLYVREALDSEQHARLLYSIENKSLSGFERDPALKAVLATLGSQDVPASASALEAFLVDTSLLLDLSERQVTAQQLTEAQISLIAYEWLV